MKKWMIYPVLAGLLLALLAPAAGAVSANGTCGDGMTWTLDNYTLTISGSGEVTDVDAWESYKTKINHVVLTGGVTKLGDNAFYGCDRLKTVDFGDSLVEIGAKAFYGCEGLTYVHLPVTFRTFGAQSFRGCTGLKSVYCDGGMPRFNDSCLWTGNYVAVFYPTNNPWPSEYTSALISSYGGNLGIMMGNFDPANLPSAEEKTDKKDDDQEADAQEQDEEETENSRAETVSEAIAALEPTSSLHEALMAMATEPETTAAETTAETTEETTEMTTAPTTEETTEETTLETTTEAAEPQEPEKKPESKGWIGLVMIAGVLTMLLAGAMIVRGVGRKNRF